jgi:ArsR family transcriptional regulator
MWSARPRVAHTPASIDYIDVHRSDLSLSIPVTEVAAREARLGRLPLLLKALADPTRLRIVGYLAQRELCVCDLERLLGISQSMTSHHLGVLRRAGLLQQRREERDTRWVYYRLNAEAVESLKDQFNGFLDLSGFNPAPAHCD